MPWVEIAAWAVLLGTSVTVIALGPRIWHGNRSWQRAHGMSGLSVIDEAFRPATFEQHIVEQQEAEAGDSVDQLEPRDRRRGLTDGC